MCHLRKVLLGMCQMMAEEILITTVKFTTSPCAHAEKDTHAITDAPRDIDTLDGRAMRLRPSSIRPRRFSHYFLSDAQFPSPCVADIAAYANTKSSFHITNARFQSSSDIGGAKNNFESNVRTALKSGIQILEALATMSS